MLYIYFLSSEEMQSIVEDFECTYGECAPMCSCDRCSIHTSAWSKKITLTIITEKIHIRLLTLSTHAQRGLQ